MSSPDRLVDGGSRDNSRDRSRSHTPPRRRHTRSRSRSRSQHRRRSSSRSPRRNGYEGSSSRRRRSRSPMSSRRRHVGTRDDPEPSRCIGIFGLSVYTSERQLHVLFEKFGPIDKCQVVVDAKTGRSRGFAFIYFANVKDATDAKEECSGMEIDGRRIRVDYSITQRAHTPTPGIYMGRPTYEGRSSRENERSSRDHDRRSRDYDRDGDRHGDRHERSSRDYYDRSSRGRDYYERSSREKPTYDRSRSRSGSLRRTRY